MTQPHSLSSQPLRADIDENYVASVLMELLNTPSPTGYTHHVMKRIEIEATQLGYSFELTRKGCGVIRVRERTAIAARSSACPLTSIRWAPWSVRFIVTARSASLPWADS